MPLLALVVFETVLQTYTYLSLLKMAEPLADEGLVSHAAQKHPYLLQPLGLQYVVKTLAGTAVP